MKRAVQVAEGVTFGDGSLGLVAGPCVIEGREHSLRMAEAIAAEARRRGIPYVFKSSYDKANRTSVRSARGPRLEQGLAILEEVRASVGVPVLTDVHTVEEAIAAADVVDVLQIPAFLCRQTDLVVAAAETGRAVNLKKGQFLAPWAMRYVVEKGESAGNRRLLVTDRGTSFGYDHLIVDIRGLCVLAELGYPVLLDVTHSLQLPGGGDGETGGERRFAAPMARAGVAAGVDALFLEVHDDPPAAPSDAATQLAIQELGGLLDAVCRIHAAVSELEPVAPAAAPAPEGRTS